MVGQIDLILFAVSLNSNALGFAFFQTQFADVLVGFPLLGTLGAEVVLLAIHDNNDILLVKIQLFVGLELGLILAVAFVFNRLSGRLGSSFGFSFLVALAVVLLVVLCEGCDGQVADDDSKSQDHRQQFLGVLLCHHFVLLSN